MIEAFQSPAAYAAAMPDITELKARFGVEVMASEVENAYFSALPTRRI
jgi:hypothetical protein